MPALTLVGDVVLEVTGILASGLVRVEHETVRTQRSARLTSLARPVLVALVSIFEEVGVVRELREGWASNRIGDTNINNVQV